MTIRERISEATRALRGLPTRGEEAQEFGKNLLRTRYNNAMLDMRKEQAWRRDAEKKLYAVREDYEELRTEHRELRKAMDKVRRGCDELLAEKDQALRDLEQHRDDYKQLQGRLDVVREHRDDMIEQRDRMTRERDRARLDRDFWRCRANHLQREFEILKFGE